MSSVQQGDDAAGGARSRRRRGGFARGEHGEDTAAGGQLDAGGVWERRWGSRIRGRGPTFSRRAGLVERGRQGVGCRGLLRTRPFMLPSMRRSEIATTLSCLRMSFLPGRRRRGRRRLERHLPQLTCLRLPMGGGLGALTFGVDATGAFFGRGCSADGSAPCAPDETVPWTTLLSALVEGPVEARCLLGSEPSAELQSVLRGTRSPVPSRKHAQSSATAGCGRSSSEHKVEPTVKSLAYAGAPAHGGRRM